MVPNGWRTYLLDAVTHRKSGHTPDKDVPHYWNGGIKWVSLADSSRLDKGLIYETDKEISEEGIKKSSAVLLPEGTVVLSRDAGVGKSAILATPMAVSQHFIAWDCSASTKIHNWYLYHWLQDNKTEFERIAVGSTIKTIGLPYFKKIRIEVPPIAEQRRISDVLATWNSAISTSESLLANSRKQKQALMSHFLRKHGKWKLERLDKISTRIQRESNGESNPVLMISATSGFVSQSDMYSRFMAGKSLENYVLLRQGEFAYNKGNSKSYEFGCIYSLESFEQGLVPHVYVCFSMHERTCLRSFYKYLFESDYLHDQLGALVNTGVRNNGLLNIRPADFLGTKVPVPPMKEQKRIAEAMDLASNVIRRLEQTIERLKAEKAALMQQLLTGKRRVKVVNA